MHLSYLLPKPGPCLMLQWSNFLSLLRGIISPNNPNNSNRISPLTNNRYQPGEPPFVAKTYPTVNWLSPFLFLTKVPKDLGSPYPQPVLMLIFLGSGNIGKTKKMVKFPMFPETLCLNLQLWAALASSTSCSPSFLSCESSLAPVT